MAYEKLVTHYDNLKVANNAPIAVIRAAYRALVQQFHPDKFADQALAEQRIKIINKAYDVLSDIEKRREHDGWIAEQKAMRAAEEMLHAAQAIRPPRADAQSGRGSEASGKALLGLGRFVERLALCGGVALLVYVLAIEKTNLSSSPPAIANAGAPPALVPPPSKATARTGPTFEDALRCFWVYAPIAQIGRDFPHGELFRFGQERMLWFDAFLKINKDDPELKQVFESEVQRYEASSSSFQNSLREALSTHDGKTYAFVIDAALSCDRILGIRGQFIPRM